MSSHVKLLFGGAITACSAPYLIDASDVRQVPDTQEVFMYLDSNVSIVVEILERVDRSGNEDAVRFHFESLAHDNSAVSSQIDPGSIFVIPNDRGDDETPSAIILSGFQLVPKYNQTTADEVKILMALYRVENKNVDLVVTFNIPVKTLDGGAVEPGSAHAAQVQTDFDIFVRSLRILDFGLFA